MVTEPAAPARKKEYSPPPINGDFYEIANLLDPKERAVVKRVRDFMETEVAPIINDYWDRARSNVARRSAMHANCSAATACFSRTMSVALLPTPKQSILMKARAK